MALVEWTQCPRKHRGSIRYRKWVNLWHRARGGQVSEPWVPQWARIPPYTPALLHKEYFRPPWPDHQFERVIKAKVMMKVWKKGETRTRIIYLEEGETVSYEIQGKGKFVSIYKLPPPCENCWRQVMKIYVFPGGLQWCGPCSRHYSSRKSKALYKLK
jgi:hypothetical protein